MKRLLLVVPLFFFLISASSTNPVLRLASDPSGACPTGKLALSASSGNLFHCDPKTGNWAVTQGPKGDTGATGPAGPTGPTGADGKTLWSGSGVPSAGLGANGDFYIDTTANAIYGPKAGGAWGSSTSIIGPTGPQGSAGSAASATPMLLYGSIGQSANTALAASATKYFDWGPLGTEAGQPETAETSAQVIMTRSGTLKNLCIAFQGGTQPSGTGGLIVMIRKNAADTALTKTLASGGTPSAPWCDSTHTVSVVAGDLIAIKVTNGATGGSTSLGINSWSVELD